jgi:hypothetical protein
LIAGLKGFGSPLLQLLHHIRAALPQWVAEVVATSGLLVVISGCRAHREPLRGSQ